ncbi:MAG: hypothetical protein H6766_08035 [Candidatus Peribacteria bacterium]|nr:MAG: hypothetical protein H6766_08035 [Candidatus Peribacteria bacterium]
MSALKTVISTITDRPQDIEQRYTAAKVIRELYKWYGKTIKTSSFINEIETIDPTIAQLLELLEHHHLVNEKSLDALVAHTRAIWKEQQQVTHIYVPHSDFSGELTKKLEKRFDHSKSKELPEGDIGLQVQKNENIYRRMLDTDVKQLLR